jgi:hypothetical protein
MENQQRWYVKLFLYISGLAITGLIGAYIQTQIEKADLQVQVTSVSITTPTLEQLLAEEMQNLLHKTGESRPIAPNQELIKLTKEHTWLPNVDTRVSINDYLNNLLTIEDKAVRLLKQMADLREGLTKWPKNINDNSIDVVYDFLRDNSDIILGHIFGELRRSQILFSSNSPEAEGRKKLFDLEIDNDGDIFVDSGLKRLPIIWSNRARTPQEVTKFQSMAERIANAVAYGVESDLEQLREISQSILQEEATTLKAEKEASKEIQLYSYWAVTATISNNGRNSIAIAPQSALYLKSKGLTVKHDDGTTETVQGNIKIPLNLAISGKRSVRMDNVNLDVSYEEFSNSPVVVGGGTAVSVTFRSSERIVFLEEGKNSLAIFEGVGTKSVLAILPLTADKLSFDKTRGYFSEDTVFQEINFNHIFPDDVVVD